MAPRIRHVVEACIRNRLHVVACSIAAAWGWAQLTRTRLLPEDLLVIPLTMASIYLWNRVCDLREDRINATHDARRAEHSRNRIAGFCVASLILALSLSLLRGEALAVGILAVVWLLGFLYSTPMRRKGRLRRLKDRFVVKNLTSALGWAVLTVIYPALHTGGGIRLSHGIASLIMLTGVWAAEIIWDIRDLKGDARAGVRTVPVVFGISAARWWVVGINAAVAALLLGAVVAAALPLVWLFALTNNLLLAAWVQQGRHAALLERGSSHVLVLLQTVLLVSLGLVAGFV